MRLLRLYISGFGNLREREIIFAPGINLVIGPNETGKSTLLHCIAQTMMGRPSKRASFPDVQPWDTSDKSAFMATLDIEHGGEHFRLVRRFLEFGSKAVTLLRLESNSMETLITQDPRFVQHWVAATFGVGDDTIFYKVFCLSQADLTPLKDNADLYEQLDRAISGAEVAVAGAVKSIDDRVKMLRRGVGERGARVNWGPLQRAIDGRQEFELKLQDAQMQNANLDGARARSLAVNAQIAEMTARVAQQKALLDQERLRRELIAKKEERQAAFTELERQREQIERLTADRARAYQQIANLPPEFAEPTLVRLRLAQVDAAQAEVERLTVERDALLEKQHEQPPAFADIPAIRAELSAMEHRRLGPPWVVPAAVVVGIIGVLCIIISQVATGLLILTVGEALIFWYGITRGQQEVASFFASLGVADSASAEQRLAEADTLARQIDAMNIALNSAQAALAADSTSKAVHEQLADADNLQSKLTAIEGALSALPSQDELLQRRQPISQELAKIDDQLDAMLGRPLTIEEEVGVNETLKDILLQLETLRKEMSEAEKAVAVGEASERELVALEDGAAYWQAEEQRVLEDEASLRLAREWLIAAGSSTHDIIAGPLKAGIAPRFAAMTNGRYPTVRVTTDAKTLLVTPVDRAGRDVPFEQLSRGTRDQFVLAVRLALGEAIAGEGAPIYFLDDPLLHFDDDRRREALAMLVDLAKTRQIIIVSHETDLRDCLPSAHVIAMDAPALASR